MIKVAIVEDVKEIREGLQWLINGHEGFSCTDTFENAEDALQKLPQLLPDVILMDINLPGINGVEAVKKLKSEYPSMQFIMSTVYEDDENIFESLKAGAAGYLLKKTSPDKIIDAIEEVYAGGSPMSIQIARKVIDSFHGKPDKLETNYDLTPKEKEVLKLLSKGLLYKEVANSLNISIDTVRSHVRHIYEKLHVQSRTEALNKVFGAK
ncbi:MAG TPA: response regulator transcription factor [Bacteroidia bacterium]|jgi:DNA-binding NarL/FixJ family response regulator|nr:response regulator transcription factor [Bacteroidia bacterium]